MRVYLDNAATTPVDRAVVAAMLPHLEGPDFGNPSSAHALGVDAERAVRRAAEQLLRAVGGTAELHEVVFTSGGTEADALAVLGLARAARGRHVVTSSIEHSAILGACEMLEREGFTVTRVAPDRGGVVSADAVAAALRPDTVLVAVMLVQNELGTIQPIADIATLTHARAAGCAVVVDAVQAFGKVPVDLAALGADAVTLSAHKIHGPKGTGALILRKGRKLRPLWSGKQQGGMRAGTENVAGIAGFGLAAELAASARPEAAVRMTRLRERLWEAVQAGLPAARRNGDPAAAAPHVLSVAIPGVRAEVLLHALEARGVYVSAGSACASKDRKPSHVLQAIGVPENDGVLRLSLARTTTEAEIAEAAEALRAVVGELGAAK